MNPHTPQETLTELGQEFIDAFYHAVYGAQDDYERFREFEPMWAATYTQRLKANFLHERIWGRILPYVEENEDIDAIDKEPVRVLNIGTKFALRIKRHSDKDLISSFRTKGAIDFYGGTIPIDGMERVGLAIGYRWDPTIDKITAPVISLQDLKKKKTVWSVELLAEEASQTPNIVPRVIDAPETQLELSVGFRQEIEKEQTGEEEA